MVKTVSNNNTSSNKTNIKMHKIILKHHFKIIDDSYYKIPVQEMPKQYEKASYNYSDLVVSSGGRISNHQCTVLGTFSVSGSETDWDRTQLRMSPTMSV